MEKKRVAKKICGRNQEAGTKGRWGDFEPKMVEQVGKKRTPTSKKLVCIGVFARQEHKSRKEKQKDRAALMGPWGGRKSGDKNV